MLEHGGADVNRGGRYGPIYSAVCHGNADVVALLLQHKADPNFHRKSASEEALHFPSTGNGERPRCTDMAIENGYLEILSMLLQHGAYVGHDFRTFSVKGGGTALNRLLLNDQDQHSLKTILDISALSVHHTSWNSGASSNEQKRAMTAASVAMFLQHSLEMDIKFDDQAGLSILVQAGVDASIALFSAIHERNLSVCRLLLESGAEPFLIDESSSSSSSPSPFQAAARLQDTAMLQLFLQHWNERFGGNRNNAGMYSIHVLASYKHVSLPAIRLLIKGRGGHAGGQENATNHNSALMAVDEKHGLYPFHFAALSDVNLDDLFCILRHYPDALGHQQQKE